MPLSVQGPGRAGGWREVPGRAGQPVPGRVQAVPGSGPACGAHSPEKAPLPSGRLQTLGPLRYHRQQTSTTGPRRGSGRPSWAARALPRQRLPGPTLASARPVGRKGLEGHPPRTQETLREPVILRRRQSAECTEAVSSSGFHIGLCSLRPRRVARRRRLFTEDQMLADTARALGWLTLSITCGWVAVPR